MFLKSLKRLSLIKFLLYLSLIFLSYEQQCVLGQNCPYNQGVCVSNICACNKGYHTLLDSSLPPEQQIYCNYKKISQYTPLILEIFLPSFGHFAVGKYWMGLLKLSLLLTFLASSYFLYDEIKVPTLMSALFEKFGIESFLGIEKKNEEGGDDNKEEGEEEGNNEEGGAKLRGRKDAKKSNSEYTVKEQVHEDEKGDENNEDKKDEKKEPLIDGGENDGEKAEENPILKNAFEISGIFFPLLYFLDLFMYKLNVYTDGFGVPFV